MYKSCLALCALLISITMSYAQEWEAEDLSISGLEYSVEILVDEWGVPHIYAKSEHDLFFAQGFYAARDRLFQFEIWRRQATGTVAELLGSRELKRDIGTRLFRYRGDINTDLKQYHDRGVEIINAFTDGVNAYIDLTRANPELLPMEFDLLQTTPQHWTPDVVISRHQGLLGNITQELDIARMISRIGEEKTRDIYWFHPKNPDLSLAPLIDSALLAENLLELYNAYRTPVKFIPEDIIADASNDRESYRNIAATMTEDARQLEADHLNNLGSNNWVVSGDKTITGFPIMANDPHRTLATPSLRYMSHLIGPGWDVIGGGEPEIPGISIGHNGVGAWGLTVFRTDAEDMYVYQLNPDNPDQYMHNGEWVDMQIERDSIPVKGRDPYAATYRYTKHGPVVYVDRERNLACAIKCGWMEPGGSPYLASLRMDQAQSFEEFRDACSYSNIPGENMIWADASGNIGWQAVGIAPVRREFSGMVPILGDGSQEWSEYLPIKERPNLYNPASGMIITANENVTPTTYEHWDAIGFNWADPYRGQRLKDLLTSKEKHSIEDMAAYQTDYYSLPAEKLVPLLRSFSIPDSLSEVARKLILDWDYFLKAESVAAGIYTAWEKHFRNAVQSRIVPTEARNDMTIQLKLILDYVDENQGSADLRRAVMLSFRRAVQQLSKDLGPNPDGWQLGQEAYKHVYITHPMSAAVNDEFRSMLNAGPAIRGGGAYSPGMTSSNLNQRSGASFRIIVDTGNWDNSIAMNSPGQSGNPMSNHYRDLFDRWAQDEFFKLCYTRKAVEEHTTFQLNLMVGDK